MRPLADFFVDRCDRDTAKYILSRLEPLKQLQRCIGFMVRAGDRVAGGIARQAARGVLYYLTWRNFWVNCVFLLEG